MTTYATFTEECDWEGETWRFYIPVEGNEEALATLRRLVDAHNAYSVSVTPLTEADVTTRLEMEDDCDYLPAHSKLAGTLDVSPIVPEGADVFDILYKGGIRELVK